MDEVEWGGGGRGGGGCGGGAHGSAASLVRGSRRGSTVISPRANGKPTLFHDEPAAAKATFRDSATGFGGGGSVGRPPDGGWGWVVVVASFLVNLIADGITFSFGVMFVDLLRYFEESKSNTAWIGSMFMAMPLLSGPIASFLTDRYGCRRCCVVGGLLSGLGFVLSSLTDSIVILFFTFGVLAGFGLSLCYVTAVVIVAYYFESKRSFATGLSVCGSGIGTFLFAPFIDYLLMEYGWRGTMLILAGFFLNLCVCGMLMRDLEWTRVKGRSGKVGRSGGGGGGEPCTPSSCPGVDELRRLVVGDPVSGSSEGLRAPSRLWASLVLLPTWLGAGEDVPAEAVEALARGPHHHHQALLHNYPSLLISRGPSPTALPPRLLPPAPPRRAILSARFLARPPSPLPPLPLHPHPAIPTAAYLKDLRVHRRSLTYRGAMLNIARYRLRASSCPDIYRNSITSINEASPECEAGLAELWAVIANMFDLSHFSNPKYLLFAASNFVLYFWYDVPYVYLADSAVEQEYSVTDGSFLISIIGILNMIGEVILGWLGDRESLNADVMYAVSMALCGLVVGVMPLLHSLHQLQLASGAFGLFIAANYALTSIILVQQITLEKFTNAYGLLLLVQGVANLIGPPLAGALADTTGSNDLAFYLAGVFIALSGLLLVLPAFLRQLANCLTSPQPHPSSSPNNKLPIPDKV